MDKPQICYVAMLDIMGFANFVGESSAEDVLMYLNNHITVNNVFSSIVPHLNISVISDSIAISTPVLDDLKADTARYLHLIRYTCCMQYSIITAPNLGLPLRGAITKGEFYSNQRDILFGKAWVEAVRLEAEEAIFPRVIVADETNMLNCVLVRGTEKSSKDQEAPLKRDNDGKLFCNYLRSILDIEEKPPKDPPFLALHRDSIIRNLKAAKCNDKLTAKYKWIKDYHNWFCIGYDELRDYLISDEDTI